jgi:molybdopterin molybdotransferase
MGFHYSPPIIKGSMITDFHRKRTERTAYVPVRLNREGEVEPVEYHGSAHLTALSSANGLLKIPRGVREIPKGSTVYVRQI